jgi:hypothetical protein
MSNCNTEQSTALSCSIPVSVLFEAPWNLQWGDEVFAKLIAKNIYGNSPTSRFGSGAVLYIPPDAPATVTSSNSGDRVVI